MTPSPPLQVGAEKADRLYEDLTDPDKIRGVLQDYLDDYNLTFSKDTKLVFFQDAVEHVSRYRSWDKKYPSNKRRSPFFVEPLERNDMITSTYFLRPLSSQLPPPYLTGR